MMTNSANTTALVPAEEFPPVGKAFSIGPPIIPTNFKYADILRRGRPRHGTAGDLSTYDSFYIKHPPMECSRRAKIFAPFDALAGFSQCIKDKQVLYEERRSLTESEREELDKKMAVLYHLTRNSRLAKENRVAVSITYFSPCADIHSEWYSEDGRMGQYRTVEGIVQKVDTVHRRIVVEIAAEDAVDGEDAVGGEDASIPVDDIVGIESEVFHSDLFREMPHLESA